MFVARSGGPGGGLWWVHDRGAQGGHIKWRLTEQWEAFLPFHLDHVSSADEDAAGVEQEWVPKEGAPRFRAFLAFDPVIFAYQRSTDTEADATIRATVRQFNEALLEGSSTVASMSRAAGERLKEHSLGHCYAIREVEVDGVPQLRLHRHEDAWRARLRTHGFKLFAVHPELDLTAEEVIDLYSAKAMVETDFRVIKSVVNIRPVHHSNEHKVRAHVDLCVLALALERELRAMLPEPLTTGAVLEELATGRLLTLRTSTSSAGVRTLTAISKEQRDILKTLGMTDLLQLEAQPE